MPYKKYIAELFGTFGLTFAVLGSLAFAFPLATPLVAAVTLMLFVYSIGGISGCHINPAVTISLWALKKIEVRDAVGYVLAQYAGAILAMFLAQGLGFDVAELVAVDSAGVFFAEALGAFFFLFGIAAVVYGKVDDDMSGVVIGGSLLLGVLLASTMSNGVLNPAVALGIGSLSLVYVVAPIIGGVLGAGLYGYLIGKIGK